MQAKCWGQRTGIAALRVLVDYAVRFAGAPEFLSACRNRRTLSVGYWGGVLANVGQVAALAAT